MGWTNQIFWSMALVATVLTAIFLAMTLFDTERENAASEKQANRISAWLDVRAVLVFFTLFGWSSVIGSSLGFTPLRVVAGAMLLSLLLVTIPYLLAPLIRKPALGLASDVRTVVESTGQVLLPIPPHRNGFGKVQLDFRQAHFELDAITAGRELPPGSPVRVVDVIDNRILVVEAINEELPPDGGIQPKILNS